MSTKRFRLQYFRDNTTENREETSPIQQVDSSYTESPQCRPAESTGFSDMLENLISNWKRRGGYNNDGFKWEKGN